MNCEETKLRLADYWSQTLGEAQVLAVELRQYEGDGLRTFAPILLVRLRGHRPDASGGGAGGERF